MPTIAISGAGSGIGHAFLTHFAGNSDYTIHAIDKSFSQEVADAPAKAKIHVHEVDTSSQESVDRLSEEIGEKPIDLFIHSAAVRGLVTDDGDEGVKTMKPEIMNMTLQINTTGTFLLIRALIRNLKAAKNGMLVVMGSRMGSIAANNDGGAYAYRASKAGLNAVIRSFVIDVPEVTFVTIHPGRVDSKMTSGDEPGLVSPEHAVDKMMKMINGFSHEKDNGKFYTRDGEEIPW